MKKIVLFFVSPFVEKKDRPTYEKEIKGKVLREDLKVTLKFIYPKTKDSTSNDWGKIKKEKLEVTVFNKCHASTVDDHHEKLSKQKRADGMFFFQHETSGVLNENTRNKIRPLNALKFLPVQLAQIASA